jgi:hypothetical protein
MLTSSTQTVNPREPVTAVRCAGHPRGTRGKIVVLPGEGVLRTRCPRGRCTIIQRHGFCPL